MKKILLVIIGFLININVDAQSEHNTFNIRNYNRSLAVAINQNQTAKLISDEFGKVISISNPANANLKYFHHGQEYDKQLGLYFYPSRIYSALSGRFFQTDPMSQYASPYSFLGGDPVNKIDETGNVGKSLFLHNSDYRMAYGKQPSTIDMETAVNDAYYVPLADFLNGEVPDLPEFNGNVLVSSHMGRKSGGVIAVEEDYTSAKFKTPHKFRVDYKPSEETVGVQIKGQDLGRQLREFADSRNLQVKSIVAEGCEGELASINMGIGFVEQRSGLAEKQFLKVAGLKSNIMAMPMGKSSAYYHYNYLMDETRLFVHTKGAD